MKKQCGKREFRLDSLCRGDDLLGCDDRYGPAMLHAPRSVSGNPSARESHVHLPLRLHPCRASDRRAWTALPRRHGRDGRSLRLGRTVSRAGTTAGYPVRDEPAPDAHSPAICLWLFSRECCRKRKSAGDRLASESRSSTVCRRKRPGGIAFGTLFCCCRVKMAFAYPDSEKCANKRPTLPVGRTYQR